MVDEALQRIARHADEGARLRTDVLHAQAGRVADMARTIAVAMARGHKLLIAGNGGSAADAQHWAGEFANRFLMDRPPLPALALTTDTSVLTAIGNDFGYEQVFAKQVQALGAPGDVFLGISTSGNSPNVVLALEAARNREMITLGLTGEGGGRMAGLCDLLLAVPHPSTPLVQEIHAAVGHLLCGLVDYYLFENVMIIKPLIDGQPER